MSDNRFECACEHGLDCTRTTMCELQSISDELEAAKRHITALEADNAEYHKMLLNPLGIIIPLQTKLEEAEATITALEADLKQSDFELNTMTTCTGELQDSYNALEDERAGLARYIQHDTDCVRWISSVPDCTCGLDELLSKQEQE